MKVAVVGSRTLCVDNLGDYLPEETTVIVSGGARGIDTCAKEYCMKTGMEILEFLPDYSLYGRGAPIVRNKDIVSQADFVLIFWDGVSRGTASVIRECEAQSKPYKIYRI